MNSVSTIRINQDKRELKCQFYRGVLVVKRVKGAMRLSGFSPSTNTDISKFQFDQDKGLSGKLAKADVASSLNVVIYLNSMPTRKLFCIIKF